MGHDIFRGGLNASGDESGLPPVFPDIQQPANAMTPPSAEAQTPQVDAYDVQSSLESDPGQIGYSDARGATYRTPAETYYGGQVPADQNRAQTYPGATPNYDPYGDPKLAHGQTYRGYVGQGGPATPHQQTAPEAALAFAAQYVDPAQPETPVTASHQADPAGSENTPPMPSAPNVVADPNTATGVSSDNSANTSAASAAGHTSHRKKGKSSVDSDDDKASKSGFMTRMLDRKLTIRGKEHSIRGMVAIGTLAVAGFTGLSYEAKQDYANWASNDALAASATCTPGHDKNILDAADEQDTSDFFDSTTKILGVVTAAGAVTLYKGRHKKVKAKK